ncbi:hypothetical protein HNQ02_003291 [Flavobacterium sp. 7E]|uniref:SecDF P1 head subdomain-containing protein n=1 Tax=Flavobacterium sp. 7E TaxID=2735898 RepID=UPI00156FB36D|nr:hypothetical protein [Flavobacterium sp. 7E]NRS90351.1 hypothetical protein [Flavobacterium sp. 7E]
MNKRYYLLIVLLLFIAKVNAQFIGYYNLRDGGVDMPNSKLYILPNNEFVLFYYAGYMAGKWKEIDKNTISLTQTKTMNSPFIVLASNDESEKTKINVYGLNLANAFINFSKDTTATKEFQPIFNVGANCLANDYTIEKKNGDYNWFTLTTPSNPEISKSLVLKYPYRAMSYTFPIDKKLTLYRVLYNEDAIRGEFEMMISKKNGIYSTYSEKKLERENLTDAMLNGIETGRKAVDKEYDFSRYGTPINTFSSKEVIIYKPSINPIFISKCDNDKEDTTTDDENNLKYKMPATDRANGFYEVVNYKEYNFDVQKYKLAKEPSVTKNDILSVNKIISDYGGYEIEIVFTKTGSVKFAEFSKRNIRKPMAVVVNNFIVSAPIFASEITGGKAKIKGDFSEKEIDELIFNLKNK